jgi:NTE family protein
MPPLNHLGLSLSGGGYRASAFHLGTLRALHKLQILPKVDVLSTISGGSITGAAYCLHQGDYESFEKEMAEKIRTKNVIGHILTSGAMLRLLLFALPLLGGGIVLLFTSYAWIFLPLIIIFFVLLFKFQFHIFPTGREVERAYDKFFYKGATLKQLCSKPLIAIGSSNLQTGRPFTFSAKKMADSTYSYYTPPVHFLHEDFPIARAVTASSCVPFAFTPVAIDRKFFKQPADYDRVDPKLIDGGVYDNQGIQKLTQERSMYECSIIITSDAGGKLSFNNRYRNTITLLVRTVDLFMNRIKAFQMADNIYMNAATAGRQIAYLSLGWDLESCIPGFVNNMINKKVTQLVMEAHGLKPEWIIDPAAYRTQIEDHLKQQVNYASIVARDLTKDQLAIARGTGTNLTPLSHDQVKYLSQHAENLTELQVQLYCPKI